MMLSGWSSEPRFRRRRFCPGTAISFRYLLEIFRRTRVACVCDTRDSPGDSFLHGPSKHVLTGFHYTVVYTLYRPAFAVGHRYLNRNDVRIISLLISMRKKRFWSLSGTAFRARYVDPIHSSTHISTCRIKIHVNTVRATTRVHIGNNVCV